MKTLLLLPAKIVLNIWFVFFSSVRRNVGGQAVIEGVMMRSPRRWSVAVRSIDKRIYTKTEDLKGTNWVFRLPLVRGTVALLQSIKLGIKAIEFSASCALEDDTELSRTGMFLTILFSVLLAIVLFVFLPLYLTKLVAAFVEPIRGNNIVFNLTDGIFRVVFFLVYILMIGLWSEMKRVFQYHGAEHKTIHAYENAAELEPSQIMKNYSTEHPRCGTSFLLFVMIVSIVVFSLIPRDWTIFYKFMARVLLVPLIAGISYEILKYSARAGKNPFVRVFVLPGFWLQKLTTKEPSVDQVEVAVMALKEAVSDGDA